MIFQKNKNRRKKPKKQITIEKQGNMPKKPKKSKNQKRKKIKKTKNVNFLKSYFLLKTLKNKG